MNYSNYTSDPVPEYNDGGSYKNKLEAHVKKHGLVLLKSHYLDTNSYYYDPKNKIVYIVPSFPLHHHMTTPKFSIINDSDILAYNGL